MSLSSILTSAAFAPIRNVGWIRITGEDRVRWLNGMVTNSIAALKPGEGCYNFFLNAQGRIQGDATAWMLDDAIMLETAAGRITALMAMLDHFIIMDDVELADVTGDGPGVFFAGGDAFRILQSLNILDREPDCFSAVRGKLDGREITVIHAHSPLVPRFELWPEPETLASLTDALSAAVALATPEDLEQLRILEGTPQYGVDIRDKDLPQETNQTRALHFSKGCYLGQEIVERIRSRGAVHRTFSGFILSGELPASGAVLSDETKPVGELTSVTHIELPGGPVQLALGYIRREAVERGAMITYPGGTATPSALPFQLPRIESLTHV